MQYHSTWYSLLSFKNWTDISSHAVGLLTALWLISFSSQVLCTNPPAAGRQKAVRTFGQQQNPYQLRTSEQSLEREIKGGEIHSFTISLVSNQYARLVVRRRAIDLMVNIIAPQRSEAMTFENPAGADSPIFALIRAETPGTYTIELRPVRKWLAKGRYEIQLLDVPAPSPLDEKKLLAQNRLAEGRHRQLLETPESYQAAIVHFEEALALWRETDDNFEAANTLQLIAQTYVRLSNIGKTPNTFDKAEEYYKLAIERRGNDPEARAYTLLDLADAYNTTKSPLESLPHYEKALAAFRDNKNRRGEALVLTQLGLIHMRQYDWEGARKILEKALDIDRNEGDVFEGTRVLNALGGVADNQGKPEQAMRLYEEARDGFHQLGDSAREGNMYINIGLRYDTWGDWQAAFASYDKALNLLAAGEAAAEADLSFIKSRRASLFYNIGSLFASLGDYEKGLHYLQKSLDLRPTKQQGPTLMWFGYTYVLSGEPDKALPYCNRAIILQEEARDPRIGQTYTVMGMAQDSLGNHDKAVEYFDKALEIQRNEKTLDLKGQAITLDKRGRAYAALRQVNKARTDLEAALVHWRTYRDRNGEALTLFHLAGVEGDSGNVGSALANAEAATRLIEPLRENAMGQQLRASYFADKLGYYELYIDLLMRSRGRENKEALTIIAFEASERARARGLLDLLSEAGVAGTPSDATLVNLIEKRRLIQRSIRLKTSQRAQAVVKNLKPLDLIALDRELTNLNAEQGSIEGQITSSYPHYAALTSSQPQRATTIQQQLDDNTLLLEYALGDKRSYVWVVTQDSINGFELAPRNQIEVMARRVTEALTVRNRDEKNESFPQRQLRIGKSEKEYSEASVALSNLILSPVASLLGQKRLVVVADGALHMVPFAAMPAPATSATANSAEADKSKPGAKSSGIIAPGPTPLISTHEIVTLPSASVLALQRRELGNRKPAPYAVAVLADPVFDLQDVRVAKATGIGNQHRKDIATTGQTGDALSKQGGLSLSETSRSSNQVSPLASALRDLGLNPDGKLPRLSLSRQEARAITRVAPANQSLSALDFKASRETATSPELSKYRIIHFATHGVLDLEHPELSGIVLSMVDEKGQPQDGYLRLHEIYNLNLPAEMVVLSACQTGIGKQIKGEGLIALTRGFMYAGAKSVVASLWKVDDAATSELMAEFYKQMFTNKLKPAAALRAAQVKMSQQKRWQSPYYWAGFFLQGEWN